jgi:hypothetical protein
MKIPIEQKGSLVARRPDPKDRKISWQHCNGIFGRFLSIALAALVFSPSAAPATDNGK